MATIQTFVAGESGLSVRQKILGNDNNLNGDIIRIDADIYTQELTDNLSALQTKNITLINRNANKSIFYVKILATDGVNKEQTIAEIDHKYVVANGSFCVTDLSSNASFELLKISSVTSLTGELLTLNIQNLTNNNLTLNISI